MDNIDNFIKSEEVGRNIEVTFDAEDAVSMSNRAVISGIKIKEELDLGEDTMLNTYITPNNNEQLEIWGLTLIKKEFDECQPKPVVTSYEVDVLGAKTSLQQNQPRQFKEESLGKPPAGDYIVPDNLDGLLSSKISDSSYDNKCFHPQVMPVMQGTAETEAVNTQNGVQQPILLAADVQAHSQLSVPVSASVLELHKPSDIPEAFPEKTEEPAPPKSRRKQVLKPKRDLEDEVLEAQNKPSESQVYQCNVCDKSFAVRTSYRNHMKIHSRVQQLKCAVCNEYFKSWDELNDHSLKHTEGILYICIICKKPYSTEGHLARHLTSHQGVRPYKCSTCDERFSYSNECKHHEETCKSKVDGFQCLVCRKMFSSVEKLETHSKMHSVQCPYHCTFCTSSFVSFKSLSTHTRNSHSNEKRYKCKFCGESFPQGTQLIHHIYRESGKCTVCDEDFTHGCELQKHMEAHAAEKVQHYLCKVCHRFWYSKINAHRHVRKDHPAELEVVKKARLLIEYVTGKNSSVVYEELRDHYKNNRLFKNT